MGPRCTWPVLLPVALLLHAALASSDFPLGANFTAPLVYQQPGLAVTTTGTVLSASPQRPGGAAVTAAIRVVAGTGGLEGLSMCSLVVLLGDVTAWASDHNGVTFLTRGPCRLELTVDGDLRLTDGAGIVGWSSSTAGRRAKVLHLTQTGNLVLLDAKNQSVWQSFDEPTDKLLRGQQIRLPSSLTAPVTTIPSAFYSLELGDHTVTANLHVAHRRYTYWELTDPSPIRSMEFAEMDVLGLKLLDGQRRPVAHVSPAIKAPVSFLALGDEGNLGMYSYDGQDKKFRPSYKALGFCQLPLACGLLGVCSAAGKCNSFSTYGVQPVQLQMHDRSSHICNASAVADQLDMAVMRGIVTVLRPASPPTTNVTMEQCADSCLRNCSCAAALHVAADSGSGRGHLATHHGECSHYELTAGAGGVIGGGHRHSYLVKVPRTRACGHEDDDSAINRGLTKILIFFGTLDAIGMCIFIWLCAYYCIYLHDIPVLEDKDEDDDEGEAGRRRGGVSQNPPANSQPVIELN
uniref:non-specific serine/threonine protein kinase n=1 Tax=Oryza brachyantha TaxID=4533 RepID=J3L5D6_ORYBR